MKIKAWFVGGIIVIAVVAGVFEALSSPRRSGETKENKEEVKKLKGNCTPLQ